MSINRIDPEAVERLAAEADALLPGLSPLAILSRAGYVDYSTNLVLSMTFGQLLQLYADFLREKADYTPGTHGAGQDPAVAAHHAEYASVAHER